MSFIIGIDFDNTIACYDQVFCAVGQKLGLLENGHSLSKSQVKELLLENADGDLRWQRLQGKVYGKYMHLAKMFAGFFEFLLLAKLQGHKIVIVSHKSEFGHFDEEKISLRNAALLWMEENGIEGKTDFQLERKDIFFASTRSAKIEKIRELKCDYFIDDLLEVLDDSAFPASTTKILFDPHSKCHSTGERLSLHSWRQIIKELLVDWKEAEIVEVVSNVFPDISVKAANIIKGRGNSRIYRLKSENSDYALKLYPDRQLDKRARLETEYSACSYLTQLGFPVMQVKDKNPQLNWAIYHWVSGHAISSGDDQFIGDAVNFVKMLQENSHQLSDSNQFTYASESCLSGKEIVNQIDARLERLKKSDSQELAHYLQKEFYPVFKSITEKVKGYSDDLFTSVLPKSLQILSPSDFGFHNAIRTDAKKTIFIDFEYFGWDDPVKLVSDFYCHPGMNLSALERNQWIDSTNKIFHNDDSYAARLSAHLPLYALRWSLILLNEFLPDRLANRLNANNQDNKNIKEILETQLNKSKTLLNQVIEDIPNYGSAL